MICTRQGECHLVFDKLPKCLQTSPKLSEDDNFEHEARCTPIWPQSDKLQKLQLPSNPPAEPGQPSVSIPSSSLAPGVSVEDHSAEPLPFMVDLPSEDVASTGSLTAVDAALQQAHPMQENFENGLPQHRAAAAFTDSSNRNAPCSEVMHRASLRQRRVTGHTSAPDPLQRWEDQQQGLHRQRPKQQQQQRHDQPLLAGHEGDMQHHSQAKDMCADSFEADAPRSITTPHTIEMARVLSSLSSSNSTSQRLAALSKVNGLRGILANGAVKLRLQHLKVNPPWIMTSNRNFHLLRIDERFPEDCPFIEKPPLSRSHVSWTQPAKASTEFVAGVAVGSIIDM